MYLYTVHGLATLHLHLPNIHTNINFIVFCVDVLIFFRWGKSFVIVLSSFLASSVAVQWTGSADGLKML